MSEATSEPTWRFALPVKQTRSRQTRDRLLEAGFTGTAEDLNAVAPEAVVVRDPQIVLASWCGKPVDITSIGARPGWERVSAVTSGRIHEVDGADILSPGPSLLVGLRQIHEIIQQGLGA